MKKGIIIGFNEKLLQCFLWKILLAFLKQKYRDSVFQILLRCLLKFLHFFLFNQASPPKFRCKTSLHNFWNFNFLLNNSKHSDVFFGNLSENLLRIPLKIPSMFPSDFFLGPNIYLISSEIPPGTQSENSSRVSQKKSYKNSIIHWMDLEIIVINIPRNSYRDTSGN